MVDRVESLGTERIGQLTGSRDPEGRLLLNVTNPWTAEGVDLGANTEHNGRLYFFFGDVATTDNGEHRWQGWEFFLPNDHQGATETTGQPDWRFCGRCHALFWAPGGNTAGAVCPIGGEHHFHPDSLTFFLPNDHQGATEATGQRGWRFCDRCHGLFWAPDASPAGTTCPAGGEHHTPDGGWEFFLPNDQQGAMDATGQKDWRFCRKCRSLAWFPGGGAGERSACPAGNPRNADLVAWTDDRVVTPPSVLGHEVAGWDFVLPNDHQGATEATGQPDWRFCGGCQGLFWAPGGDVTATVCPNGGRHWFHQDSWMFFLPNDHQGATAATGQKDWRFCGRCHGLFWAPNGVVTDTVCPVGGAEHSFHPQSWMFFLPNRQQGAGDTTGQPEWRFCARCHGLFWAGTTARGVCPVKQGGGIRLHPVMKADGTEFDPLAGEWPLGVTKSLEAPGGAFSHDSRAYVFVNISPERWSERKRPGDPQYGTYLISKDDPQRPGPYRTEFLFSPRVGACPRDDGGAVLESHVPLGNTFVLPHDLDDGAPRQRRWRRCTSCAALFLDADGDGVGGRCWATGAAHRAENLDYALPLAPTAAIPHQAKWQRCGQCDTLFWNGDDNGRRGRCRAGGAHQPAGPELALPHQVDVDNPNRLSQWRFCVKCAGLFWTGVFLVAAEDDLCPKDGRRHEPMGLDFTVDHSIAETAGRQGNWRHCRRCAGMFWDGDGDERAGVCPRGGVHEAGSATAAPSSRRYAFVLTHSIAGDDHHQTNWRFCGKCTGLFWAGHPTGGVCPSDHSAHRAGAGPHASGFDFALAHFSPGDDRVSHESGWRFCTRCFAQVWTGNPDRFGGVAPTVVRTADHDFLPPGDVESTLLMTTFGFAPNTAFRLACLPLRPGAGPALAQTRYYTGRDAAGHAQWSVDDRLAVDLFAHEGYTSVSVSWQPGPRRWLMLYSNAHDGHLDAFERPAVARLARTPMEWADVPEVVVFDPAQAYGRYMHKPGLDTIDARVPPGGDHHKGWAYGLHLLDRYTRWSGASRELDIYYLLSLSSPYQVQLMHTKLRITDG